MVILDNPKNTIEIIQKYQFAFQKKFGQNFLIDTCVLDKIISATGIIEDDCVLEIEPGTGTMTRYLAEHVGRVVAMEIGTSLLPILDETLEGCPNMTVISSNILRLGMNRLVGEYNDGRPIRVAANLLYYATTPVIMGLFESNVSIDNIAVMVQKKVADRMQVRPGSKDYGALSLVVQHYARPYIVANVPPNCFIPRPNVGSAVVRLARYQEPPVQMDESGIMFRLIRTSSNQRRRALQDGLDNSPEVPYTKEQIASTTESLGVLTSVKGKALALGQFASLANYFTRTAGKEADGS